MIRTLRWLLPIGLFVCLIAFAASQETGKFSIKPAATRSRKT